MSDYPVARRHLQEFYAECDKVGLPYSASALVQHHRANAGMAMENWKATAALYRAKVERVEALLAEWEHVGKHDKAAARAATKLRAALEGSN